MDNTTRETTSQPLSPERIRPEDTGSKPEIRVGYEYQHEPTETEVRVHDRTDKALHELKEFNREAYELGEVGTMAIEPQEMTGGASIGRISQVLEKHDIREGATEFAKEILLLEKSPLFSDMEEKITRAFPIKEGESQGDYEKRIARIETETKRPFFELLANGKLKAADITKMLHGIKLHDKPPANISHAVASVSASGGRPEITFYTDFFDDEKNRGRDHIVKHELGHIISSQIFSEHMAQLMEVAKDPAKFSIDSKEYQALPEHLQMVVAMVRQPDKAAEREHRGAGSHLHRELIRLHNEEYRKFESHVPKTTREEHRARLSAMRAQLAREILAERVANYFESDGTLDSYAALRFGNVESKLIQEPNNRHFSSEASMFKAINEGMAHKDEWVFGEHAPPLLWGWEDDYLEEPFIPFSPISPVAKTPEGRSQPSVLEKFFMWLISTNKH